MTSTLKICGLGACAFLVDYLDAPFWLGATLFVLIGYLFARYANRLLHDKQT